MCGWGQHLLTSLSPCPADHWSAQPTPAPCSALPEPLERASVDPCCQHLCSHPAASCTVCYSVWHLPPEWGDLLPNKFRKVWFVNIETFSFFQYRRLPLENSFFTVKGEQCWKHNTRHSPIPWQVYNFWRGIYPPTIQTAQLASYELLTEILLSMSAFASKMIVTCSSSPI